MDKIKLGKLGEKYAANFLISQNYQMVATNFRCKFGEIDIVSMEKQSNELVFVEVKTRTDNSFGEPEEAIHQLKKEHLIRTALYFLNSASPKACHSWRIDLIAVKLNRKYELKEIKHIKNILDGY